MAMHEGLLQVCAAVGLCDQSGRSVEAAVSRSRRLLTDIHGGQAQLHNKLGDDTFCQFCTMAVSYIKVSSSFPIQTIHGLGSFIPG